MRSRKIFGLLLLVLFVQSISLGQKKKSEVEIIDFGEGTNSKTKKDVKYNNSIIKLNPISVLYGKVFAEYEREMLDWMSIQGGLGITVQPYLEHSLSSLLPDFDFENEFNYCDSKLWVNDECDNHLLSDKAAREGKLGFMANASVRLFPSSDGFDGSYFSFAAEYANYRFDGLKVEEVKSGLIYEDEFSVPETANLLDFSVRYGYQTLHPKLSTEYFIGATRRTKSVNMVDIGRDGTFVYRNGMADYSSSTFILQAGVRIGFQL